MKKLKINNRRRKRSTSKSSSSSYNYFATKSYNKSNVLLLVCVCVSTIIGLLKNFSKTKPYLYIMKVDNNEHQQQQQRALDNNHHHHQQQQQQLEQRQQLLNNTKGQQRPYNIGKVTATVVTCNRLGFAIRTLDSLFRTMWGDRDLFSSNNSNSNSNNNKVIVIMDCYNSTFESTLSNRYGDDIRLVNSSYLDKPHITPVQRAIYNQMDALNMVETKYWLSMEEDWEWITPGFLPLAMKVLEEDPIPWMVLGRGANTFLPEVNASRGWKEVSVNNNNRRKESYGYLNQNAGPGGVFGCYTANTALHRTDTSLKFIGNAYNIATHEPGLSQHLCQTQGIKSSIAVFKKRFYIHLGDKVSAVYMLQQQYEQQH